MTPEKVLEVIGLYESLFIAMGIRPIDYPHDDLLGPNDEADVYAHCYGMFSKMRIFLAEGRTDKVMRWLGFIQGCLWSSGVFALTHLMEHSRPDE